jgi:hypothetical protein
MTLPPPERAQVRQDKLLLAFICAITFAKTVVLKAYTKAMAFACQ